jgi:hypothetical protein
MQTRNQLWRAMPLPGVIIVCVLIDKISIPVSTNGTMVLVTGSREKQITRVTMTGAHGNGIVPIQDEIRRPAPALQPVRRTDGLMDCGIRLPG